LTLTIANKKTQHFGADSVFTVSLSHGAICFTV
jgi:hypothetical protein